LGSLVGVGGVGVGAAGVGAGQIMSACGSLPSIAGNSRESSLTAVDI
jgi:hypothetical protein